MTKYITLTITLLTIILFTQCNSSNNDTSVDQVFSEPVLKRFEKETGIKIKALYDTEETKSTGVLNRIIAEKNNPQCDVFWSGDPVRAIVLKNKGITQSYNSPQAKGIDNVFKDPQHHWTGFSARARVIIYNKNLLSKEEIPHSIFDFTTNKLNGNAAIANPLFGTTTFHIAALFTVLGDTKAKRFLQELKNNNIVIATSNGDVKKQVMQGVVACGLTDTDDAFEAVKEDANTGYLFPDQQDGLGSLIIPNAVCLIKGSPNTSNGKKLIDFLLSKKTEAELAVSCAQMPLRKGVPIPSGVQSLDNILPMKIDYNKTALKLEEIQNFLKKWSEQ